MATAIPIEVFELLETKIGREEAKEVTKAIEAALEVIEQRAKAVAIEKKLEIRDELTGEMATKSDLARVEAKLAGEIQTVRQEIQTVRQEIQTVKVELDRRFMLMFTVLFFTIVFLNQNALEFLARVLGLIT